VLLQVVLLLMVIAQLGRIPVFSTGGRDAPILFNDLFVGGVLLFGLTAMAFARQARLDTVALTGLLFAAIGGLSALLALPRFGLSIFELAASLAYLVRWLFYFALYIVMINVIRAKEAAGIWNTLETAILIFATFGIFQAAFLPNFALMVYPDARHYVDWDLQHHRLVSTVLDPNFAGALILCALLVQLARLSQGASVAAWKPLLLLTALVLTVSRSSILAFLVGGTVILAVRGLTKRLLQFAGVVVVLMAISAPRIIEFARAYNKFDMEDPSALSRVIMWMRGLRVLSDHLVIGIGFNTWGYVQESYGWERYGVSTYSIEGGLLFVAVMTGLLGLVIFLWMFAAALARCRRLWRSAAVAPEWRGLAVGTAAFTCALIAHSAFTNSLFYPFLIEPLFVLWALTHVVERELA
jgi:O-antigen ligase